MSGCHAEESDKVSAPAAQIKKTKILFYPKFYFTPPKERKKKKKKKVDTMGTYNSVISFFDFLNIRSPTIWHSKICFGVVWRAATLARQV